MIVLTHKNVTLLAGYHTSAKSGFLKTNEKGIGGFNTRVRRVKSISEYPFFFNVGLQIYKNYDA